jgi:hypothetical protein
MDLEQILAAVNDLSPDDLERLKAYLATAKPTGSRPGKEWLARFDAALDDFWADTSSEERKAIIEAINVKSAPSEKGL